MIFLAGLVVYEESVSLTDSKTVSCSIYTYAANLSSVVRFDISTLLVKKRVSFIWLCVFRKLKVINIKFAQSAVTKPASCGLSCLTNSLWTYARLNS